MESYLNKDFDVVDYKNQALETLAKWRKAVRLVKNPARRWRHVANLAKRAEAEWLKVYDDSDLGQSLLLNSVSHTDTGNNVQGHVSPGLEQRLPPLSIGANNVTDQPHHGTRVYDDSNLSQSLLLNSGSHADTGNNVQGHVSPDLEQRLPPLSIGANNVTDQPHHGTRVYDDSNLGQSLLLNSGSHADTGNNVQGHVSPDLEQRLPPLSIGANNVTDQPHHGTKVTTSYWIFSATGLGFEAVSAFFDQFSSPQKPHYALYGMLLSVVAVLVCILDLICNSIKPREVASGSAMLWVILPEVFGLALACVQCISSALQFSFICRHAANPVKVSLVPFLFFLVLFAFKYRNERN